MFISSFILIYLITIYIIIRIYYTIWYLDIIKVNQPPIYYLLISINYLLISIIHALSIYQPAYLIQHSIRLIYT